jgi:hypothetical protein
MLRVTCCRSHSLTLQRAHALHKIPVNASMQGTHRTHYIEHTFYREHILSVSRFAQDASRRQAALEASHHHHHPPLSNSLDMPHTHEVYQTLNNQPLNNQPLNNQTNSVVKTLNVV